MSEILFLAHRVPFPPNRGDKIRSHHVLKRLALLAPVHVGTLGETDEDMAQDARLSGVAASHCLARREKPLWLAGVEAFRLHEPVSLAAFRNQALMRWVRETLATRPVSAIYVFSGQMGQYVPADFAGRVVCDLVDVDSAKFEAYARQRLFPANLLHAREARLLEREEAQLAARADATLLVSEEEAALFRQRSGRTDRVHAMGNGVDTSFFDPALTAPHGDFAERGPNIVFTGQMDYRPNVAAALRIAERLLPAIRDAHPNAQFHVVGRAPAPALTRLDGRRGVRVWGAVPDMRPFLAGADLVLAPLELARGVQNKVLEAMAMARPVLATSSAALGTGAEEGRHLLVADKDAELIAEALALLGNRTWATALGGAARQFVHDRKGWRAALAELPALMGFETPRKARDAA